MGIEANAHGLPAGLTIRKVVRSDNSPHRPLMRPVIGWLAAARARDVAGRAWGGPGATLTRQTRAFNWPASKPGLLGARNGPASAAREPSPAPSASTAKAMPLSLSAASRSPAGTTGSSASRDSQRGLQCGWRTSNIQDSGETRRDARTRVAANQRRKRSLGAGKGCLSSTVHTYTYVELIRLGPRSALAPV